VLGVGDLVLVALSNAGKWNRDKGKGMTRRTRKLFAALLLWLVAAVVANATDTVTYVYTDPQGTPLAEADASGNITATFDYTPYGTVALGVSPNGPGYTGHVNDPETNLVYMQARYYDAATGHFISTDPIGPTAGNTFGFNRYAYVNDNPIIGIDPTGKEVRSNEISCGATCRGEQRFSLDAGGGGASPSKKQSNGPAVNQVFEHYQVTSSGVREESTFPSATYGALEKILSTPVGRQIGMEAISMHEKIPLTLMPASSGPGYQWSDAYGVLYSLDVSKFIASHNKFGELSGMGLDGLLVHEFGHSPVAARAFGYTYSPTFKWSNEFDVVRNVENPYRAAIGLPLRQTYGGVPVSSPVKQ
jgi:RHS repeat-associated protein